MIVHWIVEILLQGSKHCNPLKKRPILRNPFQGLEYSKPEKTADILRRDATADFPAKWLLRNKRKNSILMTRHYPELASASDWLKQIPLAARPIRSG